LKVAFFQFRDAVVALHRSLAQRLVVLEQNIVRRSHDAVIRVYDETGNVVETDEQTGEFKERRAQVVSARPFSRVSVRPGRPVAASISSRNCQRAALTDPLISAFALLSYLG
jgi:hypothetical protein